MDLNKKFNSALEKLPSFKKVVVGCSGGVDSVVLAHVLKELGVEVVLAHLNHGLRAEASDGDEFFVKDLAQKWGLTFVSQKVSVPKKGNLEAEARVIRRVFLKEVMHEFQADFVALGHHFDDQIETVLMHERRGAGLRGQRGMQLLSDVFIRPLLDCSRAEIEAYAKVHALDFRMDASNLDPRFTRNHLRHRVIPELNKDPAFESEMRIKIKAAQSQFEQLQSKKNDWLQAHFRNHCFSREAFASLDESLQGELLIEWFGSQDLYAKQLKAMMRFIRMAKTGALFEWRQKQLRIEYDRVRVVDVDSADLSEIPINGMVEWGNYRISVTELKGLKVRSWRPGDRFRPAGMQGSKKLQDFFVDAKVPRYVRHRLPIVVDEKDVIVSVANLRFSEAYFPDKERILIEKVDT